MWAYQLTAPERFERIYIRTPTEADLGDGDVLLRTLAGAVCGSDIPTFRGEASLIRPTVAAGAARVPGYPMHEVVGEVVATRYSDIVPGERVVGWATRHDALAEYVITRGDSVFAYTPELAPVTAVLLQTLACVIDTVQKLPPLHDAHVAVLGQGPIGLLFSLVCKESGARKVTGVDRVSRADLARRFGVDDAVHSSISRWAELLGPDDRPNIVIEAVGHQMGTLAHAVNAAAFGAHIFYFGVPDDNVYPLPMNTMLRKHLTLAAGYALDRRRVLRTAQEFLLSHPDLCDSYISHVVPVRGVGDAFLLASRPSPGQAKVVIQMSAGGRP